MIKVNFNDENHDVVTLTFDSKRHETELAVLYLDDDGTVWVPKSLIRDENKRSDGAIDVDVPEWWAIQEDLI